MTTSTWSRDDCPHNVRCFTQRACKRYEGHKERVRRSFGPIAGPDNDDDRAIAEHERWLAMHEMTD